MYKSILFIAATILLSLPAYATTINSVVFDPSGNAVGIENLQVGGPEGPLFFDVEFTDLGRESVSFNNVFGTGPVQAVRTFERFQFVPQGVLNTRIRSEITFVLQRFNPRQNGLFVFPPINTDNNRTIMLLLDTDNEVFLGGLSTETSSSTLALRRDEQLFNTSFAIVTEVGVPVPAVPLPATGWMLLTAIGGTFAARRTQRFRKKPQQNTNAAS